MRIEYWGRIRRRANSYYIVVPAGEAYKFEMHLGNEALKGKEVRVEVTL